ncbi:MAG TPA: hypothetical protein DEF07_05515 [Nitrosomonas sp.]|nr:hypothetical protein [Nitrosomonas sp.]
MSWNKIGVFQVDQTTSCRFAQVSGDYNPLHVDSILARRYQFGSTVIHGVCGVFKTLDLVCGNLGRPVSIASIKVQFSRPILPDDNVEVFSHQSAAHGLKLRLLVHGKRAQDIDLEWMEGSGRKPEMAKYISIPADRPQPVDLQFEDVDALESQFGLVWDPDSIQLMFPHVKKYLPDNQSAVLLGLTNIVGMQCPGLHSVFAGFNVHFVQNESSSDAKMHFRVIRSDSRFSMVTISISHNTASGEVTALFRPKPVSQEKYTEFQALVSRHQFADQQALVIGGSRGIGEVTAKLIAAGGGHSVITYHQGKDDATRIVNEIRSHGGKCDKISYNVLSPLKTDITSCFSDKRITHIYYFASPLIEKGDHLIWDEAVFQKFCSYYITGFANLIERFLSDTAYSKNILTVFAPSTIFLEQPQKGFNEYIASKAAVEAFVRQLATKYPNWVFYAPRLPRMLTDQTSGLATNWTQNTAEVMLDALSLMNCLPVRK